jgi:hypothetical protein
MDEKEISTYQKIDKLYEIYHDDSVTLENVKQGINSFTIEIRPSHTVVMPLDAIFKNIHCDAEFPFVKYNPGVRRENIYRFYSTAVSKNGKKIPYLPKKKIENLVRTISNHKQISIYNVIHKLIISIEPDGVVKINVKFKEDDVKTIEQMAAICSAAENSEAVTLDADFLDQTFTRIDQSIALGALFTAYHLKVKAIAALTESGSTALWMSRHRIHIPIYALTKHIKTQRAMAMYRKVIPMFLEVSTDRDAALGQVEKRLLAKGAVARGDIVALTVGEPMGQAGGTNTLKIIKVQ